MEKIGERCQDWFVPQLRTWSVQFLCALAQEHCTDISYPQHDFSYELILRAAKRRECQ